MVPSPVTDQTRGAIILTVLIAAYCGAVHVRHERRPTPPQRNPDWVTQLFGRKVGDIMRSDALALMPTADEPIDVLWLGRSIRLQNRAALVDWLCHKAPQKTSVVLFRGELRLQDGRVTVATGNSAGGLEELSEPPLRMPCASSAKFYALEVGHLEER